MRVAWSRTSVRLIAALVGLALVVCATLAVALAGFHLLCRDYERLVEETLPDLARFARIAQLSQAVASAAPALTTAEGEYNLRATNNAVVDQVAMLNRHLDLLVARHRHQAVAANVLREFRGRVPGCPRCRHHDRRLVQVRPLFVGTTQRCPSAAFPRRAGTGIVAAATRLYLCGGTRCG